jgi:hypothetical protein
MFADPLGPPACRLRGWGRQGRGTCVDLVGVRAHGRYGIAAVELGEEPLGITLIGHPDEGHLLDLFPASTARRPLPTSAIAGALAIPDIEEDPGDEGDGGMEQAS